MTEFNQPVLRFPIGGQSLKTQKLERKCKKALVNQPGDEKSDDNLFPKKQLATTSPNKLFDNFLVDRNSLAEMLSLAPSTISKMMADEGLPHYKIGKSCRFKVSEVMAFLENRRRP